jgi:hypothetical protein
VIGYYAHHHGSGHVTRMQAIAAHVHEPIFALSSLQRHRDWHQDWLQLARDDTPSPTAAAALGDVTAGGTLHWVPPHHEGLGKRMAQLADWMSRRRPRLLVVDVSAEVALLGRLCGVPTVVVAMPGNRLDRPHRLAYDSAEALMAPWPEGAHSQAWPAAWRDKTWFLGGISRFDDEPPPSAEPGHRQPRHERTVLVLWGAGGREQGTEAVDGARMATPGWKWLERDPAVNPSPDLWRELGEADVVVTHAGENAVAEVAAARRPAVVVAQSRPFDEQVATASAVDRLGVAIGLPCWPSTEQWPSLLARAAALGGDGWRHWSTGVGARTAAARIDDLAGASCAREAG